MRWPDSVQIRSSPTLLHRRIGKNESVIPHQPKAEPWVHSTLEVRPSRIAEHGLFASDSLSAGDRVIRFGGRIVTDNELEEAFAEADRTGAYVDTLHVHTDRHLVLPASSTAHFGNHSCDPNVWLDGPFDLVARRNIASGEEVTVDYATFSTMPSFAMTCHCGTASCRGRVTGNDWQLPELQARYSERWAPVALSLIASRR